MTEKTETEVVDQPSYLEMSDEDVLKLNAPPSLPEEVVGAVEKVVDEVKDEKKEPDEKGDDDTAAGDSKAAKSEELPEVKKDEKSEEGEGEKTPEAKKDDESKNEKVDEKTVDYKAEYERLMAPFKANGKEVKVESVDDAVALMQMGANYNKKMAALKPNLKLIKMLENNGFLSEDKISFLIDLGKKDPAAINKLVKESGIDPIELDATKADAYKQKTYAVGDAEIDLDTVLDDLQGTPTYTRTLDVVSNKWDAASKQVISQTPELLKVINDHMASGIYDLISAEVEREQMLGRLSGLSNLEAYRKVGDAINARRGFDHLAKPGSTKSVQPPDVIPAKQKAEKDDDKLNEKRRAASSTKPVAPVTPAADFNPLGLSDEEFSKLAAPKFR